MKRYTENINEGLRHLRRADPVMRNLIRKCPPLTSLRLQRNRFGALAHSILSQQISIHAARAIRSRLIDRVGRITPNRIRQLQVDELKAIGISGPKANYLKDLAQKVESKEVRLNRMARLADAEVIEELTRVKGIGIWTAQMFLIFSLGRLDVFPHEDYGVRKAIQNLYALKELPNKEVCLGIAKPWRPYSTIASWYCWRSHELDSGGSGGI